MFFDEPSYGDHLSQPLADPHMGTVSIWFVSISEIQKYAKSVYLNEKNLVVIGKRMSI